VRRFVFGYQENDFIYEGKELPVVILIFTIDNERMFGLCDYYDLVKDCFAFNNCG
jgi:hypothetical protein